MQLKRNYAKSLNKGKQPQKQSQREEPLPATPAVRHRRSGSRSRPRVVARLDRELATVTANVRTISRQNAAMKELIKHMQGQLVNSLQNEEVVLLEIKVNVDVVTDCATNQMIGETIVPSEYSKAIALN
ncbi:Hypothetical predicted protein, partial [Olea europaea subsp. europaea]